MNKNLVTHLTNERLLLCCIILFGALLRFYNLNWDSGYGFHPDERAIIMTTLNLTLPSSINEFFSPQSGLNPHFFAYGAFPMYILKFASFLSSYLNPVLAQYGGINIVGRVISAIADMLTLFAIFHIGKKIFPGNIGLLAAGFYAIAVFPIQASHFYAVDVLLTCFITVTLLQLIRFYEKPTKKNAILLGVIFACALATKVSALPLIVAISITLVLDFFLVFIKQPHKPSIWITHIPPVLKRLINEGVIIVVATLIAFIILHPYSIIDFKEFLTQSLLQSRMTYDVFTFPYTLQYVGKTPYLYELKQVFWWGLGPILASFAFAGFIYFTYSIFRSIKLATTSKELIIFSFFILYFAVVGRFAVGWMRYMLPIYPLLCLFAALFIRQILQSYLKSFNSRLLRVTCYVLLTVSLLIWPFAFMNIYTQPQTRIKTTEWINQNIPAGSKLAVEHWDDRLPLSGQQNYTIVDLPLYDIDTSSKWAVINEILSSTDYIIIASNRLYTPLQKLTTCETLPLGKCYPLTSQYYKDLFSGKLGYVKIAEFVSYPTIPFTSIEINDQAADESFSVYDHPKIIIFKKL